MKLLLIVYVIGCYLYSYSNGFVCPMGQDGMYSNDDDPSSFWHCSNNHAYLKPCPLPLVWSQEQQRCDWKVSISTTTTLIPSTTVTSTITTTLATTITVPTAQCSRLITFDNIPGAGRSQQPLPNGFSGFQWMNGNYMNVTYHQEINGWSGYNAALSSGQYVGLNKDGQTLFMINNAAKSFTLKSMVIASAWNDDLTLEITGKRGGSVLRSLRLTLQLKPQYVELNWPNLEIASFATSGGVPNPNVKGRGSQFAVDNLCVEFAK